MIKKLMISLLLLSCLIPPVYADELVPLLRTRTSISKYVKDTDVKLTIRISAPYRQGVKPVSACKWELDYKNAYGRYQRSRSGYLSPIRYRMYVTLSGLKWKATKTKYFFNLQPGEWRFRVYSYDGCVYTRIYATRRFTIKTSIP